MSIAISQGMAHSDVEGEGSSPGQTGEEDVGGAGSGVVGAYPCGRNGYLESRVPCYLGATGCNGVTDQVVSVVEPCCCTC